MPPPLTDGSVTYADGTTASVDQEAHDVVTFLSWAAEPKMEERKHIGLGVMVFMLLLSGLHVPVLSPGLERRALTSSLRGARIAGTSG